MYDRQIRYDRETRDYALYLNQELVGFARTYHEGEVDLDNLVFELLSDGAQADDDIDDEPQQSGLCWCITWHEQGNKNDCPDCRSHERQNAQADPPVDDPLPDPGPGGPGVPGDDRPPLQLAW